jgi:hypothetical protein
MGNVLVSASQLGKIVFHDISKGEMIGKNNLNSNVIL